MWGFAPTKSIVQAEQVLLSLFRSHGWSLEANTYTHLSHHLSSLPSVGTPIILQALSKRVSHKTGLSSEFLGSCPLQESGRDKFSRHAAWVAKDNYLSGQPLITILETQHYSGWKKWFREVCIYAKSF